MTDDFLTLGTALSGVSSAYIQGQRQAKGDARAEAQENRTERAFNEELKQSREQYRIKKQLMDMELQRETQRTNSGYYQDQDEATRAELELLKEKNEQALGELKRIKTYQTFDHMIENDYDHSMLNNLLQDPEIQKMWDATYIQTWDPNSGKQEDANLANQVRAKIYGLKDGDEYASDSAVGGASGMQLTPVDIDGEGPAPAYDPKNISKRFVKVRTLNGEIQIRDLYELIGLTGYSQYIGQKKNAKLLQDMAIREQKAKTIKAESEAGIEPEEGPVETLDQKKMRLENEAKAAKLQEERLERKRRAEQDARSKTPYEITQIVAEAKRKTEAGEELTDLEEVIYTEWQNEQKSKTKTAGDRKTEFEVRLDLVTKAKKALDDVGFLEGDISPIDPRVKNHLDVLKQSQKTDLSDKQKDVLMEASKAIELGTLATTTTSDQEFEAALDNSIGPFNYVKRMWDRKIKEKGGDDQRQLQARNALTLQIRKMLAGVAVNPQERKDFNAAYGSDSDQLPVILNGLVQALQPQYKAIQLIESDKPYLFQAQFGEQMDGLKNTLANLYAQQEVLKRKDLVGDALQAFMNEKKQEALVNLNKGGRHSEKFTSGTASPKKTIGEEFRKAVKTYKGK